MRDPFANYDSWLEQPYQDAIEDNDRFMDWAEAEGYDLEDEADMNLASQAYEQYLADMYEDWALAQYESRMDRLEDERYEMEDW